MLKPFIFILFISVSHLFSFSQSEVRFDGIIYYKDNKSISLIGISKPDTNLSQYCPSLVDTLINRYDFFPNVTQDTAALNEIETIVLLDSTSFSSLLKSPQIILNVIQYGYSPAGKHDPELTKKYGARFTSGGCVYDPDDFEEKYMLLVRTLLLIRNGKGWEERYAKDYKKLH